MAVAHGCAADDDDAMTGSAGDEFEQTCLPLLPDCYAFALSLTRRSHDAEDLVQETFVRAQRAFASFTLGTNAKAWLFTILRRLHIDQFRRARIRPSTLPEEELTDMAVGAAEDAAEDTQEELPWDDLSLETLRAAMEAIPEPFRLAVRLRDLDGFSYREIGEILDVPPGTVMSRLHRGREYLRRTLVSQTERPRSVSERPPEAP